MKAITLLPEHLERTLLTGMMPETNQLPLSEKNGGANRARNTPTCSWLTPSSTGDTLDSTVRYVSDQLV